VRADLVGRGLPAPQVQRSDDAARLALVRNGPAPAAIEPAGDEAGDRAAAQASRRTASGVRASRARRAIALVGSILAIAGLGVLLRGADDPPRGTLSQPAGAGGCIVAFRKAAPCGADDLLDYATAVAVSGDGRNVYVASYSTDAVAVYARDPQAGALDAASGRAVCDVNDGRRCNPARALAGAEAIVVSPDGDDVYVAAGRSNAVAAFARGRDGMLVPRDNDTACISEHGDGCIDGRGLLLANGLAISPDGSSLYVASHGSDAVAVLRRDETGELSQSPGVEGCVSASGSDGTCMQGRGLYSPEAVAISPGGDTVYAASSGTNEIAVLRRSADGTLSQRPAPGGCLSREDATACARVPSLSFSDGPNSIAVSPDGKHVYVASSGENAVLIFDRLDNGELDPKAGADGCIARTDVGLGCATGRALLDARGVVVSADGRNVYVTARRSGAVAVFDRDPDDGTLRQKPGPARCVAENAAPRICRPGRALHGAVAIAMDGDAKSVYVASRWGLAILDRR